MKVLSIGRDTACDIVLNDDKDMISRRHAMLYISPMGKMTLVDQGQNGTYVNGIKINPNVPYPVSRTDIVSFARVRQLDWKQVPNNFALIRNTILGLLLIAIIVGGGIVFVDRNENLQTDDASELTPIVEISKDTVPKQKEEPTQGKQKPPQALPSKEDCIKKKREKEKKEKSEKEMREKKDSTQVSGEASKDSIEYIYL